MSHDFLATSYSLPGISSSLHLTVEGGGEAYGDSVPAIFFHPHVTSFFPQTTFVLQSKRYLTPSMGCWWSLQWTAFTTSTPMSRNTDHRLLSGPTLRFYRQFTKIMSYVDKGTGFAKRHTDLIFGSGCFLDVSKISSPSSPPPPDNSFLWKSMIRKRENFEKIVTDSGIGTWRVLVEDLNWREASFFSQESTSNRIS